MSAQTLQPPSAPSPLDELAVRLGLALPNIKKACEAAKHRRKEIESALADFQLPDETSLVVFGSLARDEQTGGSDVDWTLLIDGPADPQHFTLVNSITEKLQLAGMKPPSKAGAFGAMASSHELVHLIGGDADTNPNMTRRMLLLLESAAVGADAVRERVIRTILNRYIVCGPGVSDSSLGKLKCPRFLLNDVVRLWRTFAVDYAAKKWQQADQKWAIRNVKLRMPRKLTFVKGLLLCFDCELFHESEPWQEADLEKEIDVGLVEERLVEGCHFLLQYTPLDALARVCDLLKCDSISNDLFTAYDSYLELIGVESKRKHLENDVDFNSAYEDKVFKEAKEISSKFGKALEALFFDNEVLKNNTRKYGVF